MKKNYSTKDIIETISDYIRKHSQILLNYTNFDDWEKEYRNIENSEIKMIFPEFVHHNFPLKTDVLKFITKELFNIMPFSKANIFKLYEKNLYDIDYLFYPSSQKDKVTKLMIFFSGFSGRKTYNRFSWYWDETEKWESDTIYLFLNDMSETWYLGTPNEPRLNKYIKIIEHIMKEYAIKNENIFTIGGSMGGYIAILLAFKMKFKASIAVHPQITYKATRKYINDSWETKIRQCEHLFYDLTDYIFKTDYRPLIYLEYGMAECDIDACEEFITALQKKECLCFFRKSANSSHNTDNPSFTTIENLVRFFQNTGYDDNFIGDNKRNSNEI